METGTTKNMVYKLLKTLYNLKQSLQLWYKRLSMFFFKKLDLKHIYIDHSNFVSVSSLKILIFSIFVDDIKIIVLKNSEIISKIKQKLIIAFSISDIGPINFYYGLRINQI